MGWIEKRKRKKGVVWRARYRDPAGRQRNKTFDRKVDAERFLANVESSMHQGTWLDPDLGQTTIEEWAPQWLASKRRIKPKTRAGYESLLRSKVLPTFGSMPLNQIQRVHVEQWISDMEDADLSASRIRQAFNVLAAMLDAAIANQMIARNVARGVELPRIPKAVRRFLDEAQVLRLADAVPIEYRALILVLSYSGIRWGEAVALRRGRCELLHGRLQILESATLVEGKLTWGSPKTHRQRSVSIPRFVCEDLATHLEHEVEDDADALVFTSYRGGPLRNGEFIRKIWRPAIERANLPSDLTPHELRHTAASLLIATGASPKSVQAQLGHSTITTTFDTYGHLFEGHLDDAMDELQNRWDAARGAQMGPKDDSEDQGTVIEWPDRRDETTA